MDNGIIGTLSRKDKDKEKTIYQKHLDDGIVERRYGIVVVMDVLGWKNKANPEVIKTYVDLINVLRIKILSEWMRVSDNVKDEDLYIIMMSDTICIFLDIDDSYCELNIFKAISEFIVEALGKSFAFRGAISRGEYFINKKQNVFSGEAIYEAIKYAEKTDWAGIILTDSISKALLENNNIADLKALNLISYDNIPYKKETPNTIRPCYKNLVLVPKSLFPISERNIFVDLMNLYEKVLDSDKEDVRIKLNNTKVFLKFLIDTFDESN
jgi:hypothetical protein